MAASAVFILLLSLLTQSADEPAAPAAAPTTRTSTPAVEPPQPGPELLNFTPEQIEQAYAGR